MVQNNNNSPQVQAGLDAVSGIDEPSWTPGPWEARLDDGAIFAANVWIADTSCLNNPTPEPQVDANAHLIAAAPELAECLAEAIAWEGEHGDPLNSPVLRKWQHALARARGEQP